MKKTHLVMLILIFTFASIGLTTAISKTYAQGNVDLQAQLQKAAEVRGHDALRSKEWITYLTPKTGQRGVAAESDALTFSQGQVTSRFLSSLGYLTSNFTLTIDNDGTISWETMQTDQKEENLAFITGGLKNGVMKGVVVLQPKKGAKTTYFYSTLMPSASAVVETQKKKQ
jgi:hypothetical protein